MFFFTLSTLCHVVFFGMFIVVPGFKIKSKPEFSIINVSMVTLPTQANIPEPVRKPPVEIQRQEVAPETPEAPKHTPEIASKVYPKPPATDSLAPVKKIKKSLKKETFTPAKMVEHAITEIEKKVKEARPDQITQAIDRLKDNIEKTGELDKQKHNALNDQAMQGVSGPGSKRVLELIDIYRIEVAFQIQKNWAFSEQLAGGRTDLVAELAFTIMPNGEIKDIWFDKRSGNVYLDESAQKAILKSNPVRPHPPGVLKPFIIVGLRFTPKGVGKTPPN
ncbi:MAG: energy transducer TonB [Pseudomonadota bacterium]